MVFFRFMADWDIWGIVGLVISTIPSIFLIIYLFPRRRINNFYIDTKRDSINQGYPKVVRVTLTNHTNQPLYVLSEGFRFGTSIRPSPLGAKDAATGVYEIKFEGRIDNVLSEIDTLVRPNQLISTWIPVDPSHSDQEIDEALKKKEIGVLELKCLKLTDKRQPFIPLRLKV
jgi:hypothetical protein